MSFTWDGMQATGKTKSKQMLIEMKLMCNANLFAGVMNTPAITRSQQAGSLALQMAFSAAAHIVDRQTLPWTQLCFSAKMQCGIPYWRHAKYPQSPVSHYLEDITNRDCESVFTTWQCAKFSVHV